MHHIVTEHAPTCTFLLQNGAFWGMGLVHCVICATGLNFPHNIYATYSCLFFAYTLYIYRTFPYGFLLFCHQIKTRAVPRHNVLIACITSGNMTSSSYLYDPRHRARHHCVINGASRDQHGLLSDNSGHPFHLYCNVLQNDLMLFKIVRINSLATFEDGILSWLLKWNKFNCWINIICHNITSHIQRVKLNSEWINKGLKIWNIKSQFRSPK